MKLDDSRRSDNVEDDRGSGVGRRGAGIGIGTIVIVVIGYFMGVSPSTLLSLLSGGDPQAVTAPAPDQPANGTANDPQVDFVRAILGETEDVWGAYFQNMGKTYVRPKLVLFSGQVSSACGFASAAAGPFYCPGDQKVYIDLSFYRQLATEFGAPGDFARAYVIAHEVGHHVQNLLGITGQGRRGRAGGRAASARESCSRFFHRTAGGLLRRRVGRPGQQCTQDSRARRFAAGPSGCLLRGRRHSAKA